MKYGDHGKRNKKSFSILMDILNGHNRSDELKDIYTRKMTLNEAVAYYKRLRDNSSSGASGSESLLKEAKEYADKYNRKYPISNKAVEYHLRHLAKEGLIVKQRDRYYVNFRSSTAVRGILFLMRDLSSELNPEESFDHPMDISSELDFREGFNHLMDIWGKITGFEIKDAIRWPEQIEESFWKYTVEFMSVPKNLRDFFTVWVFPDYTLERAQIKGELESRYYAQFDPKRHKHNKEHFARILAEDPDLIREQQSIFGKFDKRLSNKFKNDKSD